MTTGMSLDSKIEYLTKKKEELDKKLKIKRLEQEIQEKEAELSRIGKSDDFTLATIIEKEILYGLW